MQAQVHFGGRKAGAGRLMDCVFFALSIQFYFCVIVFMDENCGRCSPSNTGSSDVQVLKRAGPQACRSSDVRIIRRAGHHAGASVNLFGDTLFEHPSNLFGALKRYEGCDGKGVIFWR